MAVCQTLCGNGKNGRLEGKLSKELCPSLYAPAGVAATENRVYVADSANHRVCCIDLETRRVVTLAGDATSDSFGTPGYRDTSSRDERAMFRSPSSVAMTPAGELLICDSGNNRIRLLRKDGTGGLFSFRLIN